MTDTLLSVRNVSKKFALSTKRAMWYGLCDIARVGLMPARHRSQNWSARLADAERGIPPHETADDGLRRSEFWALRDISFDLKRGECIGLVGANGAGKSTLFSILSGIYGPTTGRVEFRGQLQALIALGAGFHPMFSGRENIYINAAVYGLTRSKMVHLVDRIIEFSELGDFIEAPVRSYSSGMLVRLGFSVAAHLDPDILLIDEVLAVGDSKFQVKCQEFTRRLWHAGKGLMLVSHYMQNIQGMCNKAIWLDHGRVMMAGDVHEVTDAYQSHLFSSGAMSQVKGKESTGGFAAFVKSLEVQDDAGHAVSAIDASQPCRVVLSIWSAVAVPCGRVYVVLNPADGGEPLFHASMLEDGRGIRIEQGLNRVAVVFDNLPLRPGHYSFYACVRNRDGVVAISNGLLSKSYEVVNVREACRQGRGPLATVRGITRGPCHAEYRWELEPGREIISSAMEGGDL